MTPFLCSPVPPPPQPSVASDEGLLLGGLPLLLGPDCHSRPPSLRPRVLGPPPPPRPVPSIPPLPSAAPHGGREEKGINLFRSTSHQKRLIRTCNFSGNITVKCHGAVGRRPGEGGQLSPRAPGAASLSICETKAGCV